MRLTILTSDFTPLMETKTFKSSYIYCEVLITEIKQWKFEENRVRD